MSVQKDPRFAQYHASGARMIEPSKNGSLSRRLVNLAKHRKRTSGWWSAEITKLVAPAEILEAKAKRSLQLGLGVGLVAGLALGFYLMVIF